MKVTYICPFIADTDGSYKVPIRIGQGGTARTHWLAVVDFDGETNEPTQIFPGGLWVFRQKVFRVSTEDREMVSQEEVALRVKHAAFKQEKDLTQIQKEVAAFENFERIPEARRERIPESVRLFVWQRDGGRCVRCESNERLEFDHIIPIVAGGSSTERNVQLLCEGCNRAKGKTV